MEIVSSIQATLAPLFLTNGIALFNLVQQNRYARTSDRLTYFFEKHITLKERPEMTYLEKRISLIRTSMLFAYNSILFSLLTSLAILPISFINLTRYTHQLYLIATVLFSISLLAFLMSLLTAIREVRVSYLYFRAKIESYKKEYNLEEKQT
jgi:hypothetical protein